MNEPPQDLDSERSLLSTICQPGAEQAALECAAVLRDEDFFSIAHKAVFQALKTVLDESGEVSSLSIRDALERSKNLARVGGYSGLNEILGGNEVGRPMVLVEVIQRHRKRRDLIRLGCQIARSAQDDSETPEGITETAGNSLSKIAMHHDRAGIRHIGDFSDDALSSIQDEMQGSHGNSNWVKGWSRLNGMTGGFHPGQLIILAARPGQGKTALALNWILGVTEYAKTAGLFSLEMQADRLWRRLASAYAGVDIRAMIANRDKIAFNQVGKAKMELDQRGIWIDDRSAITPREIMGEVDGLIARQPNLGLLVVDHLGLVNTPDDPKKSQNEATRIGGITRALKQLAGDRKIPVLLLCQLNREVEKRQGGRPQLSDLRDSGRIEEDADVVMFIHHKPAKPGEEEDHFAELIIAKQREGPIGEIGLNFDPNLTRFVEIERQTTSGQTQPQYQEPESYWEAAG